MKLLPEVCLGPTNNLLNFGDDPAEHGLRPGSRSEVLQSLTDCLVLNPSSTNHDNLIKTNAKSIYNHFNDTLNGSL